MKNITQNLASVRNSTRDISIGDGLDNERLLGIDINDSFLEKAVGSLIEAN